MWNVTHTNGKARCLAENVSSYEEAWEWVRIYRQRYVGKQYPNKRGFYSVHSYRPVKVG